MKIKHMESKVKSIPKIEVETYPIKLDEVGTLKDNAQYFYQLEFKQGDIVAKIKYKKYLISVTVQGDQHLYYDGQSLTNDPETFLQHYNEIEYRASCRLVIKIHHKKEIIYNSDNEKTVFDSVIEILRSISKIVKEVRGKRKKHSIKSFHCPLCKQKMCNICYSKDQLLCYKCINKMRK